MLKGLNINYIALNQNILGKLAVIGSGFKSGSEVNPIETTEGFKLYLNGTHKLPEIGKLQERYLIGKINHPYAMMGPPDNSGLITYEFFTGEDACIVSVELELEDIEDDPAIEVLGVSLRKDLPEGILVDDAVIDSLTKEIMLLHFKFLFSEYESIDKLINDDWIIEGDYINNLVNIYYEK